MTRDPAFSTPPEQTVRSSALPAPRGVTAAALVRGLSTSMRWIGPAALLLVLAVIGDSAVARGLSDGVGWLVLTWVPVCASSVLLAFRPSRSTLMIHFAVGITVGTAYVALAVPYAEPLGDRAGYIVEGAAFALIFVGALGARGIGGIGWIAVGFALGTLAITLGHLLAGQTPQFSADRAVDAFIMAAAFAVVDIGWRRTGGTLPAFRDLARETRRADERRRRERAAAAVVHDTVLSDLAAIAHGDGPLDAGMRDRIRADLDRLEGATASDTGTVTVLPREGTFGRAVLELVEDHRWRGGRVDLAGFEALRDDDLGPVAAEAMHGALRAALDNVRRHARAEQVEITVGGDDDRLTLLIVDDGVGFDTEAVPLDRLGLRESIVGRMARAGGSARIWSSDAGTTVLLAVPRTAEEVAP